MVENVITSRLEIQGYENIKQIKDEITKLRQQMKELATGTEEYKETADQLVRTEYDLKQAMASQKKDNSSLVGSYNELVNQMGALKKVWRETTDEAVRADYGAQINALNTQLKQLDATTGNYQRNVGDYKNQLKQAKKELAQLTQGTAEYNAKLKECAEIQHNFQEQQTLIKNSAADFGDQLDNVVKIGSGMASGFAALNAAMGLFGKDTEDVQKALLKVQQTMALVQGLEGLEGMWKKCEQLSTALGLVKATTTQVTTATAAEGVAMEGAAAAATVEAGATEGATVAQRGLNAAMKANPIGLVVAAVTALVAIFVALKDKFKDLIANNDEATKKFNKFKETIAGIGNVVKKWLILPIKNTITTFKTLGGVMNAIIHGEFKQIKTIVAEGAMEMAENTKEALDVVNNYQEGAAKKAEEINEEASRKNAEKDAKDLERKIKNLESEKGANAKYLTENKALYDSYFKAKADMYKKDTEEREQAIRDQNAYNREFNQAQVKEAQKTADEVYKEISGKIANFNSLVDGSLKTNKTKAIENARQMLKVWKDAGEELPIELEGLLKGEGKWSLQQLLDTGKDGLNIKGLEKFKNALDSLKKSYEDLKKQADKGDLTEDQFNAEFAKIKKAFEMSISTLGADNIEELKKRLKKEFINTLLKPIYDEVIQEIQEQDNKIKSELDKINAEFEENAIQFGTTLDEEVKNEEKMWVARANMIGESNKTLNKQLDLIRETLGKDAENSELYKNITRMVQNNETLLVDITNEHYQKLSDIRVRYGNAQYKEMEENMDRQIKLLEQHYAKIEADESNAFNWNKSKVKKEFELMNDSIYSAQTESYGKMIAKLQEMVSDEQIVAEERANIQIELDKLIMEWTDIKTEHEIANLLKEKESWENLYDTIQFTLSSTEQTLGNFSNAYTTMVDVRLKKNKDIVASDLKANKITEDVAKQRNEALEEQAAKEYDRVKGIQIAQATINMISGALGGFMQCVSQFGVPYGPILGAALATSTIAYGTAQIAQIRNTNPYNNNSGGGSSTPQVSTTSTPSIDEYSPVRTTNITGAMETEALANAITKQPVWVSVQEINSVQDRVRVKDQETSF